MKNFNDIEYIDNIKDFEVNEFLDDNQFFIDEDEFYWWNELSYAIEYLKDNNIKYNQSDLIEIEDYITLAKQNGFKF
jgi:hypothetical protein